MCFLVCQSERKPGLNLEWLPLVPALIEMVSTAPFLKYTVATSRWLGLPWPFHSHRPCEQWVSPHLPKTWCLVMPSFTPAIDLAGTINVASVRGRCALAPAGRAIAAAATA